MASCPMCGVFYWDPFLEIQCKQRVNQVVRVKRATAVDKASMPEQPEQRLEIERELLGEGNRNPARPLASGRSLSA